MSSTKGLIARETLGANWYMDQNVNYQTFAARGGTPTLRSAITSTALKTSGWAQSGTLGTQGWTASTAVLNVGDTFTIAGVYMANPQNRAGTSQLRTFRGDPRPARRRTVRSLRHMTPSATWSAVRTSDGSGYLQSLSRNCIISGGQFRTWVPLPLRRLRHVDEQQCLGNTGPQTCCSIVIRSSGFS